MSILSYSQDILGQVAGESEILDVLSTVNNRIVKAETEKFGTVCLKISARVFEPVANGKQVKFPRYEIGVFKLLGNDTPWVPRMLANAEDNAWFIREWVGDTTVNKLRKTDWTSERLRFFWLFMQQVLEFFHGLPEPLVIRDIKPQNIAFDGRQFFFFDFNTANTLKVARNSSRSSRMGNNSNLSMAPEIVQSDVKNVGLNSDYFSFASLIYKFVIRRSAWSNSVDGLAASRRQYLKEYDPAAVILSQRLHELGFSPADRKFLGQCLHPDPIRRPDRMQAPE